MSDPEIWSVDMMLIAARDFRSSSISSVVAGADAVCSIKSKKPEETV